MPVTFHYNTDNEKYAQCYRIQELLRIAFNKGNLTREQHEKLEEELIKDLLKLRNKIKNDNLINAAISDIYGI